MRAILVDKGALANLSLGEAEEPSSTPSETLVRVSAISLNRGEVRLAQMAEDSFKPGWDLAGTVEQAAADGTGPRAGARVVGLLTTYASLDDCVMLIPDLRCVKVLTADASGALRLRIDAAC